MVEKVWFRVCRIGLQGLGHIIMLLGLKGLGFRVLMVHNRVQKPGV